MYIREFFIDQFGVLQGQAVSGLPPGISVFLGDNEAGKSTCLDFFRATLFGYARNRRNVYEYAAGSKSPTSGGTLLLQGSDGGLLRLTRRPGKHGGSLTLTGADGSPRPASDLELLLRGCTADLYDKVFAFSLGELAQVGGLKEDAIRGALHGAAFGTGLRSPGQVLKELDEAKRNIFAPKATTSKIHKLLDDLEALQALLDEKGGEVARYAGLQKDLIALDAELEAARTARRELEGAQRAHDRRLALRRRWETLREAEQNLAALPECSGVFAPDGRERLERLEALLADRRIAASTAKSAFERLERDMAGRAEQADAKLLAAALPLASLRERKENVRAAVALLPDLAHEAAALRADLAMHCAALGEGWDASRIAAYDLSLAVREECATLGRQLTQAEQHAAVTEESCRRAARECAAADAALRGLTEQGGGAAKDDGASPGSDAMDTLQRLLLRANDAHENTGALALAARGASQALGQALAAIHPDWTRQNLEQLALTPADRERLSTLAAAVWAAREARIDAARAFDAAESACVDARQRLAALPVESIASGAEGGEENAQTLAARGNGLRQVQAAFRALDAARRRHEAANDQLNEVVTLARAGNGLADAQAYAGRGGRKSGLFTTPRALTGLAALLALAAGGAAAYIGNLSGSSLLLYAGVGESVLGFALLALGFVRPAPSAPAPDADAAWQEMEQRLIQARQAARKTVEEAEAALRVALARSADLFPDGGINPGLLPELLPELLAEAEARIMRQRELLVLRDRDISYLERERAALSLAEGRRMAAAQKRDAAARAEEEAHQAWREALGKSGLPQETEAKDCGLLLEKIDAAFARRAACEARDREAREAEERINACRAFALGISPLAGLLASLPEGGSGLAPEPGAWLEAVRQYMEEWREAGHERIRLRELTLERETRLGQAKLALAQAEQDSAAAREIVQARQSAWQSWLAGRHLSSSLSPETARLALDTAAKAKSALEQSGRLESRRAELRRDLADFARDLAEHTTTLASVLAPGHAALEALASLAEGNADPSPARSEAALGLLDELAAKASAAAEADLLRREREKELPAASAAAAEAQAQVASAEAEIAELLRLGGCDSSESFRRDHGLWARREDVTAAKNSQEAALRQEAADLGLTFETLLDSFSVDGVEALAEQNRGRELALSEASLLEQTLAERRGGIAAAMRGLTSEAGLSDLLGRRESLKEEIRREAEEWSRLALAKELLLAAKRRFESERRGNIIHYTGELFSAFTGGAYSGITLALDDEGVRAVSRRGEVKNPENELSRGTREQLYLALRLAYVRDHGAQAEKLPVIMDDILVNFDGRRAENTAKALAGFATDNQILFFTCHESTADILAGAAPESVRYTLRGGVFERA